jgi:hypothetical protein
LGKIEFVRAAVANYIGAHPSEPASKGLLALAQRAGNKEVKRFLSLSSIRPGKRLIAVDIGDPSTMVDELGHNTVTYPSRFEFPDDRKRVEEG